MTLQELANWLFGYIQKHPENADKEFHRIELDYAATKDNIKVEDTWWTLSITNGMFDGWSSRPQA